jgi:hypothetical protein
MRDVGEFFLAMAGFLTFINISCMGFTLLLSGTIVYSWYKSLVVERDKVPELLAREIHEQIARWVEPLVEAEAEPGSRARAQPVKQDFIELEEDPWFES